MIREAYVRKKEIEIDKATLKRTSFFWEKQQKGEDT